MPSSTHIRLIEPADAAQNRGHAGNAAGLALPVMPEELGLHRAEASTNLENLPSQRMLRRNGFTPYGVAHAAIFLDRGFVIIPRRWVVERSLAWIMNTRRLTRRTSRPTERHNATHDYAMPEAA